jgi:hypothetical protein
MEAKALTVSRFKPFKTFNPPDQVRGPLKSLKERSRFQTFQLFQVFQTFNPKRGAHPEQVRRSSR